MFIYNFRPIFELFFLKPVVFGWNSILILDKQKYFPKFSVWNKSVQQYEYIMSYNNEY